MMTIRTTAVSALVVTALTLGSAFAGDIVGKVKYAGTAPTPAKIQVTKDQAVCGKAEHIDETLLVGPDKGVKNVVVNIYGILHNIHTFPKNNTPFNKAQPKF